MRLGLDFLGQCIGGGLLKTLRVTQPMVVNAQVRPHTTHVLSAIKPVQPTA